jgi:hypothetical protein
MEDPTQFNLNLSVQDWRNQLRQSAAYRATDVEELESHLRDSVEKLVAGGLSDQEAFLVASQRIGPGRALEREFAKVNQANVWLDRLLWMLVGALAWQLINVATNALGLFINLLAVRLTAALGHETTPVALFWLDNLPFATALFLVTNLLVLVMLVTACWFVIRHQGPRLAALVQRPGRLGWIAGVACLAIFAMSVLGAFSSAFLFRSLVGFNTNTLGSIVTASTASDAALSALKIIGIALLIVLLARRRVRQAVA